MSEDTSQTPQSSFLGTLVSIRISGAVTPTAVYSALIHGDCDEETEKAIRLRLDSGDHLWLPKKALIPNTESTFKLARWLRLDGRSERLIEKNLSTGGVSSAGP